MSRLFSSVVVPCAVVGGCEGSHIGFRVGMGNSILDAERDPRCMQILFDAVYSNFGAEF